MTLLTYASAFAAATSGKRSGDESFTCSWRTVEKNTSRRSDTHFLEHVGVQEWEKGHFLELRDICSNLEQGQEMRQTTHGLQDHQHHQTRFLYLLQVDRHPQELECEVSRNSGNAMKQSRTCIADSTQIRRCPSKLKRYPGATSEHSARHTTGSPDLFGRPSFLALCV
jgi:hypothetical protein